MRKRPFRLLTEEQFQEAVTYNKKIFIAEEYQKKGEQIAHRVLVEGVPIVTVASEWAVGKETITHRVQEFVMRWLLKKESLSLSALLPTEKK